MAIKPASNLRSCLHADSIQSMALLLVLYAMRVRLRR
jgi:hypothetical protein